MSRSYQKSKYHKISKSSSDKTDKQKANRKLRRLVKQGHYDLSLKDVSDVWLFSSDGKTNIYRSNNSPEWKKLLWEQIKRK